jgi:tRNA(Ser,Leu) C12 N-acetylase TAN1
MAKDTRQETAKLIVTGTGRERVRYTRSALKAAIPTAIVRKTGLKGILSLEAEGDVIELAKLIGRECRQHIGHVTAVLEEVESRLEPIKEAAVRAGRERIGKRESFCFRIHKRGSHFLENDTLTLEQEIGSAIWIALEEKHGGKPRVSLKNPDVAVVAEVLGPGTAVGVSRRAWQEQVSADPITGP